MLLLCKHTLWRAKSPPCVMYSALFGTVIAEHKVHCCCVLLRPEFCVAPKQEHQFYVISVRPSSGMTIFPPISPSSDRTTATNLETVLLQWTRQAVCSVLEYLSKQRHGRSLVWRPTSLFLKTYKHSVQVKVAAYPAPESVVKMSIYE